jgi:hypothetical protein
MLPAVTPPTAASSASPYVWFTGGVASWALASSMNQVVFSWLLVGELRESAGWVGAAQMCQQLPFLAFLLLGGLLADRTELRGLTMRLHVLAALTAGTLAALVEGGRFGLPVLLPYALCWGTIQAFASPSRDAMISHVSGGDLLRAITGVTLVQFLASAVGAQLGGLAGRVGSAATLALQAGVLLLGLVAVRRFPRAAPQASPVAGERALDALRSGLREVGRSQRLLPIALLVAANGLLFMGPFQVLCPLLVREVYRGGASDLALQWMVLPLGTIAGSLAVLLRGGVRRKGLAFLVALVGVAVCLLAIAAGPPFWGFLGLIFAWGVFHSIFFNTSRALFQELASGVHRARVLAVHSLGLLGMAPLSSLGAGLLADAVGPVAGCLIAGLAMLAVVSLALAATPVRRLE